jgi:hypothetical protein
MVLDLTNLNTDQLQLKNKISKEIHYDFNKLTEEIYQLTNKNNVDLFSNILSRNPYQSKLFDFCVNLAFVQHYLRLNGDIDRILLNDYDIYAILKQEIKNIEILQFKKKNFKEVFRQFFYPFEKIATICLIASKQLLSKDSSRCTKIVNLDAVVLLDTFFLMKSVISKKFADRHYTGILTYVDKEIASNLFFLPHILGNYSKKNLSELVSNSEENLLFKNDFLNLSDYLLALKQLFSHRIKKKEKLVFHGFDIRKIVHKYVYLERFNSSTFEALLNYRFIKRLKEKGLKLDLFIVWYENQPIDKGMIIGLREFYPKVRIKGYMASIVDFNYCIHLSPTTLEYQNKVIPHTISVIGEDLIKEVKKFSSDVNVNVGPAFRFMDLYIESDSKLACNNKKILIVLPLSTNDSIEIIQLFYSATFKIDLSEFQILIKPHPSNSLQMKKFISATKKYWKEEFIFTKGNFRESIIHVDFFISSGSTAAVEALAYGVPGIILGSKNAITENSIPASVYSKMWRLVYSLNELTFGINYFLNLSEIEKERIKKEGERIKKEFFKPITKEMVLSFLT